MQLEVIIINYVKLSITIIQFVKILYRLAAKLCNDVDLFST